VLSAVPVHAAPAVDVEKLAAAVASAMAAQVQPQPAQPDAALLASMIERAVESAMAKVSITVAGTGVATTTTVTHGPDEPVYIPSNIVGDKTVDIKTTAGVSDASGLDDAARALKSVNRPKRVRKQDNGEE
jgi:hypothetical protein